MYTQVMTKIFWGGRGRLQIKVRTKNILATCKCERNYTLLDLHNSLRSYSAYYSVIANYLLVAVQYVPYSCFLSFANER